MSTLQINPTTQVPARPSSGLTAWWTETRVFALRNLEHIRQVPEKLLDVTLQPLMFVMLFAYVFGGAIKVEGGYRDFILAGVMIQSLTFGMMGPGTAIATDLTEGVIDRFRSLPVRRTAYLSGHYVAELVGQVLSMVVLMGAGLLIGWGIHSSVVSALGGFALLLVFSSLMIWIGTYVGLLVRAPDAVMGVAFVVVFPLTFVSSTFVPMDTLPGFLQGFATWNPITVMVAAVRELFGNAPSPIAHHTWPLDHPVPAAFAYCAVLLAVVVPLTIRRYRVRTTD